MGYHVIATRARTTSKVAVTIRRMLHLCDVEIQAGGPPQPSLVTAVPCASAAPEQVRLPGTREPRNAVLSP